MYKNRIKVGVEEKKKTQGMRRDLLHLCGVFIIFGGVFFGEGENWMRRKIGGVGDKECVGNRGKKD